MKQYYLLMLFILILSCGSDDKAIEAVLIEDIERGAVLRTLEIRNSDFNINDLNSEFNILIEEQDIEDGNLLESVDVQISFVDNSPDNGQESIAPFIIQELLPSDFTSGANGLPIITLTYTFQELLTASSLLIDDIRCKDQFRLDLSLNLIDGRTFNTQNSAGTVVNNSGFFSSPFTYLINIVEPIDSSSFLGFYQLDTIQESENGIPFGISSGLVELSQGHSHNVRVFRHIVNDFESVDIEITIACDIVIATRYQKTLLPTCNPMLDLSDRVLLGPDSPPGLVDPLDDSVFELYILEGFEGYSVKCGYSDIPSKFRFSKQ